MTNYIHLEIKYLRSILRINIFFAKIYGQLGKITIGHQMPNYRTSFQAQILSAIAVFLFTALTLRGATYSAASANVRDIQSKIDLARDGDTIVVPAGTAQWTEPLEITKNITVRGAGIGKTVIYDKVPRVLDACALRVVLSQNLPSRLSGFEFRGDSSVTRPNNNGVIRFRGMQGVSGNFRLDHCKFTGLYGLGLKFTDVIGVMDHCTVDMVNFQCMQIYHYTWGGADFGHGSWADLPYWGSGKFLFIEDCAFSTATVKAALDCFEGARVVVRHNTFNDALVSAHGTEGQGRGTKQLEIYNNVFTVSERRNAGQIRSGSAVIHDNVYNNFTRGITLEAHRQFARESVWGLATGANVWDVNNSVLAPLEKGTHTGSNGSKTLVDSTKSWADNEWETTITRKDFSYIIRNKTKNRQSVVLSNSKRTISYLLSAPAMTFDKGDNYEIWKVIISLDQPGQGKSNLLSGLPAAPKGWPHNVLEPCYSWNNTDESGSQLDLESPEGSIMEGRDFFNRTPKPNYAPYTYPHPLALVN
jgi:hypothetical protein